MLTPAQIVTNVKDNLADSRMLGIWLFIDTILKRPNAEDKITQYRVTNKVTGAKVETMAQFIAAMSGDHCTISYPFFGVQLQTDRVTGYNVVLNNLEVRFNPLAKDDAVFDEMYGFHTNSATPRLFQFHMAYLNDGDTVRPVKICNVRLI